MKEWVLFRLMRPRTRPGQDGTAQLVQGTYSDYLSNFAPNTKATSEHRANKNREAEHFCSIAQQTEQFSTTIT